MFEIDQSIISIEELNSVIKRKVESKGIPQELYGETTNNIEGITLKNNVITLREQLDAVLQHLNEMNAKYEIHEVPITSHRPYIGRVIVFLKRVMRKITRWLFQTYYWQETEFNKATVMTLNELIKVQYSLISLLEEQEERSKKNEN